MSNTIHFVPTEFTDKYSKNVSYGYRVFDDHMTHYDNDWEAIPDDELEFLSELMGDVNNNIAGTKVVDLLKHIVEHELEFYIEKTLYQFIQVKHILIFEDQ